MQFSVRVGLVGTLVMAAPLACVPPEYVPSDNPGTGGARAEATSNGGVRPATVVTGDESGGYAPTGEGYGGTGAADGGAAADGRAATAPSAPPLQPAPAAGAAPTFTQLYAEIFGTGPSAPSSCAGGACHNPGQLAGLDVRTRAVAFTTLSLRVRPGDPDGSPLVRRLETAGATRMPLGRAPLSAEQMSRVRAWIKAGAKND
jgi:hypothetical protein